MAIGLAALPASVIAGVLWQRVGPAAPFWFGATLAALAAVLLVTLVPPREVAGNQEGSTPPVRPL